MNLKNRIASLVLFLVAMSTLSAQQLKTYTVPNSIIYYRHNDLFSVQVRVPSGEWQDLYEYEVLVDNDTNSKATMVSFDFDKKVEIKVRLNNGILHQVRIRPDRNDITPEIRGNEFTFTLTSPRKLSVEVNGNKLNNLHLIANAIVTNKPKETDKNVIYFGPGIHKPADLPGDVFMIPSNTTVFIDGGAILQGKLLCNNVQNVKIIGRGIIDQAMRGVEITHSKNIWVEGIKIVNPKHYSIYLGESTDVTIKDIAAFSMGSWTDGIDMMSCRNIKIDDVFLRNSDDCIAIYAHRWNFFGNSKNIQIDNAVLWADVAHPINIGLHGDTSCQGDTISDVTCRNIDILEHDEDDRNYQGAMSICSGDYNLVRNIVFDNVRVSEIEEGQLLNIRIVDNSKYCSGPGRSVEDIEFRNIYYTGNTPNYSVIEGYSRDRKVKNVLFKSLFFNGAPIVDLNKANLKIGNFVDGVRFEK